MSDYVRQELLDAWIEAHDKQKARAEAAEAERDHFMDKWRDEKKRHLKAEAERDTLADHFRIDSRWIEHLEKVARKAVARAEAAEAEVADYRRGIVWDTTCLNCAKQVEAAHAEYERADAAEAKVARVRAQRDRYVNDYLETRIEDYREVIEDLAAALADEEPT